MLLHMWKLSNAICGVPSWYISYCMFYCTQNINSHPETNATWWFFHFLKQAILMKAPIWWVRWCSRTFYFHLLNIFRLCWQCGSRHCYVWQQVLTARDAVTYHTMWDTETVFQNISVVNSIYCSARKKSMCFRTLPRVPLSRCIVATVHRFSAF